MAFDLVATLRLNDKFSKQIKSVFAQMDKLKSQVSQAAKGSSDMGAKFSAASTKMSTALDKVQTKTVELPKKFDSLGKMASQSLTSASKGANALGTSTDKAAKLSQASLKMLGSRADEASKRLASVGKVGGKSLNNVVGAAAKVPGPVGLVAKAAKLSQSSLKVMGGTSSKAFKLVASGAIASGNAFQKVTSKANTVRDAFKRAGEGGKSAFSAIGRGISGIPSKMSGMVSKMKSGFSNGIQRPAATARSAIMGIASAVGAVAIASKGFNMLKGAIEGAVARYDTLNQFPAVMEKIGFSTENSKKAINRLADGIDGLPTTLNEIAATAQRIAITTGDLDKATETSLALNNALIASGADAEKASRGTEQYLKMLSTGKVNMDSWTTLQEVMGLGLTDLAKSFGITGDAVQNQLYEKLKNGDIAFDEFNDRLIELSKAQGGFAETALKSSGGLAVAWKNVKNAVTVGVAGSLEEIDKALGGTGEIEGIIKRIKPIIGDTFKTANKYVGSFAEKLKKAYDVTKPFHPMLKEIGIALVAFGSALGVMATVAGAIAGIAAVFAVVGSGIGIAIVAIAGLVAAGVALYRNWDTVKEKAGQLWDKIKDVFGGIGDWFKETWGAMKTATSNAMSAIGTAISEGFQAAKQWVIDSLQSAWNFVVWFFTEMPSLAVEKLAYLLGVVVGWLSQLPSTFMEWFTGAKETTSQVLSELPGIVTTFIANALTNAITWLTKIATSFNEWFGTAKDNALSHIKELPGKIAGFLAQVPGKVSTAIKSIWSKFKELGSAIPKAIAEGFNSAIGGIGSAAKWAIDKLVSGVGSLADLGRKAGSSFVSGFSDGRGNAGPGGNAEPGHYHGIKYVARDNYRARLHKGERVLTAKENKEYNNGGKGISVMVTGNDFHVRHESDIDDIANVLARKIIAAGEGGA